jgi:hypothetical protein
MGESVLAKAKAPRVSPIVSTMNRNYRGQLSESGHGIRVEGRDERAKKGKDTTNE